MEQRVDLRLVVRAADRVGPETSTGTGKLSRRADSPAQVERRLRQHDVDALLLDDLEHASANPVRAAGHEVERVAEVPADRALAHVDADEPHLPLAVLAQARRSAPCRARPTAVTTIVVRPALMRRDYRCGLEGSARDAVLPAGGGGGVQRPLKFATHLPALGIETHVLAPDDPQWIHRDDDLQLPTQAWVHRARYIGPARRKPAEELHGTGGLERLAHAGEAVRPAAPRSRRERPVEPDRDRRRRSASSEREGIDVVITTSPPPSLHLSAQR